MNACRLPLDDHGYALTTILLISLVILTIITAITLSVRGKTAIVQGIADRSEADFKCYSACSQALYNITTGSFTNDGLRFIDRQGTTVEWNLLGEPIVLEDGITLTLRDGAGMVSPITSPDAFYAVLRSHLSGKGTAAQVIDTLQDWQDEDDFKRLNGAERFDYQAAGLPVTPRNFYIQTLAEMNLCKDMPAEALKDLMPDLLLIGSDNLNFLTAGRAILEAFFPKDMVDYLLSLRAAHNLTSSDFFKITGRQMDELHLPMPARVVKLNLTAHSGQATARITAVIDKQQTLHEPYSILEWR